MTSKTESLKKIVQEMKALAEDLVPYNFPSLRYNDHEDDLGIFKSRFLFVDGYPLFIYYQKSDYQEYFVETLQIHGAKSPFVPFNVICKIGKAFLGSQHLSLIEIFKEHKKIYIWSLCTDKSNNKMEMPESDSIEQCEYEGLHYTYVQPNMVDFY